MHAGEPSFGFFVPGQTRHGGHLLLNVSVLDYMTFDAASPAAPAASSSAVTTAATPSTFMPVTLRSDAHLTLISFRATAADIEYDGRRALQRPVSTFPAGDAEDDTWLPYERFNMAGFARRISRHPEPLSFEAFFVDLFGRAPPAVLYVVQGGQFAASREVLQRVPKATYARLLAMLDAGHDEAIYYLEFTWFHLLHGFAHMPVADEAEMISPLPAFSHLGSRRRRLQSSNYYYYDAVSAPPALPPPAPPLPPAPPAPPPSPAFPPAVPGWGLTVTGLRRQPPVVEGLPGSARTVSPPDCTNAHLPGCLHVPMIRRTTTPSTNNTRALGPAVCGALGAVRCRRQPVDTSLEMPQGTSSLGSAVAFNVVDGGEMQSASATRFELGDFDNDGDWDVFTNQGLFVNDGNGGFTSAPSEVLPPSTTTDVFARDAWGDFDADGSLDIITFNGVYRNLGPPHYSFSLLAGSPRCAHPFWYLGSQSWRVQKCAWGDFDGDNTLDVLVGRTLHRNPSGDGSFVTVADALAATATGTGADEYGSYFQQVVADLDNDNDLDAVIITTTGYSSTNLREVFINDGSGSFSAVSGNPIASSSLQPSCAELGDIDGDGLPELFVGNQDGSNELHRVRVHGARLLSLAAPLLLTISCTAPPPAQNNGDGTFSHIVGSAVSLSLYGTLFASFADIDGDGDL